MVIKILAPIIQSRLLHFGALLQIISTLWPVLNGVAESVGLKDLVRTWLAKSLKLGLEYLVPEERLLTLGQSPPTLIR